MDIFNKFKADVLSISLNSKYSVTEALERVKVLIKEYSKKYPFINPSEFKRQAIIAVAELSNELGGVQIDIDSIKIVRE
jgi:hypothetical protein